MGDFLIKLIRPDLAFSSLRDFIELKVLIFFIEDRVQSKLHIMANLMSSHKATSNKIMK